MRPCSNYFRWSFKENRRQSPAPLRLFALPSFLSDSSGKNLLQRTQQVIAFGVATNGDTQAVVDARLVEIAYQNTGLFKIEVE